MMEHDHQTALIADTNCGLLYVTTGFSYAQAAMYRNSVGVNKRILSLERLHRREARNDAGLRLTTHLSPGLPSSRHGQVEEAMNDDAAHRAKGRRSRAGHVPVAATARALRGACALDSTALVATR